MTTLAYTIGSLEGDPGVKDDPNDDVTANSENRLGENLAKSRRELGLRLKREYRIRDAGTLTSCSTCHR